MTTPQPPTGPAAIQPAPAVQAAPLAAAEVVDLNALRKQRADAAPKSTTFDLGGIAFTLPPFKSLPMDVQERVRGPQDGMGLLRIALGDAKVNEMISAGFTLDDMELISTEWMQRSGVEPGELQASSPS